MGEAPAWFGVRGALGAEQNKTTKMGLSKTKNGLQRGSGRCCCWKRCFGLCCSGLLRGRARWCCQQDGDEAQVAKRVCGFCSFLFSQMFLRALEGEKAAAPALAEFHSPVRAGSCSRRSSGGFSIQPRAPALRLRAPRGCSAAPATCWGQGHLTWGCWFLGLPGRAQLEPSVWALFPKAPGPSAGVRACFE